MSGTELIIHGEAALSSLQVHMSVCDITKHQAACVLHLLHGLTTLDNHIAKFLGSWAISRLRLL